MTKRTDRDEFIAILTQELPDQPTGDVVAFAGQMIRLANRSARYAVKNCNVGLTEAEDAADTALDARIEALARSVGFGAILSGDPRGAVVKLTVPSGRTNDFGQTGICVPTNDY